MHTLLSLKVTIHLWESTFCPLLSAVFQLLMSSANTLICLIFVFCLFCLFEGKLDEVYEALANAHPNMTVYKKEQIPDRFHYKHNRKIQPILAVADKGWEIVQNKTDGFLRKYSVFRVFCCIFQGRDLMWYFIS